MLNTYLTFSTHKTIDSNSTIIQVYPKKPLLWPTYMMLGVSAVTLLFNLAVLVGYCCDMCSSARNKVATANAVGNWGSKWGYVASLLSFAAWLASSTTFKMMQGGPHDVPPPNDLFGFSCSDAADELVAKFKNQVVNFDLQCKTQVWTSPSQS
jgi:hypothetical protein